MRVSEEFERTEFTNNIIGNKDGGDKFEFVGPQLNDPKWFGYGAGIAIRKQDKDLAEQLNKAIDAIRANGTYKKIQDQ